MSFMPSLTAFQRRLPRAPSLTDSQPGVGTDPHFASVVLLLGFEGADGATTASDDSDSNHSLTFGSQAEIDTAQKRFGSSSLLLSPTGSVNPSQAFVSAPDSADWHFGSGDLTIEGFVRFADLTATNQKFISHYNNTGNQRGWHVGRSGDNIFSFFSDDGTSAAPAFTMSGAFTWAVNTWYHWAVTRSGNDWRQFVDGVQRGSTTVSSITLHNSTALMHVGKFRSTGFDDNPTDGWLDEIRVTKGVARYTGNFTPPAAAFPRS